MMTKSTVSAWIGLALFSCNHIMSAEVGPPRHELRVDMEKVIQSDFPGVNAVYHAFACMPAPVKKGMNGTDRALLLIPARHKGAQFVAFWTFSPVSGMLQL